MLLLFSGFFQDTRFLVFHFGPKLTFLVLTSFCYFLSVLTLCEHRCVGIIHNQLFTYDPCLHGQSWPVEPPLLLPDSPAQTVLLQPPQVEDEAGLLSPDPHLHGQDG